MPWRWNSFLELKRLQDELVGRLSRRAIPTDSNCGSLTLPVDVVEQTDRWTPRMHVPAMRYSAVDTARAGASMIDGVRNVSPPKSDDGNGYAHATSGKPTLSLAPDEILAWASHQIKSPLSAAFTATHLALKEVRAAGNKAALERRLTVIAHQHERIAELVSSLLDAAAIHEGRLQLEPEPLDLAPVVDGRVRAWQERHPEVRFEVDGAGGAVVVDADCRRMEHILDNLLSNAVKYGKPANVVRVASRTDDAWARISVTDNGPGIPHDQRARIFERYHRAAAQRGPGHGLGLYIARALARMHGGDIVVDSEVGSGSTFIVRLPLRAMNETSAP